MRDISDDILKNEENLCQIIIDYKICISAQEIANTLRIDIKRTRTELLYRDPHIIIKSINITLFPHPDQPR
jgi:hypothetical protein